MGKNWEGHNTPPPQCLQGRAMACLLPFGREVEKGNKQRGGQGNTFLQSSSISFLPLCMVSLTVRRGRPKEPFPHCQSMKSGAWLGWGLNSLPVTGHRHNGASLRSSPLIGVNRLGTSGRSRQVTSSGDWAAGSIIPILFQT